MSSRQKKKSTKQKNPQTHQTKKPNHISEGTWPVCEVILIVAIYSPPFQPLQAKHSLVLYLT